ARRGFRAQAQVYKGELKARAVRSVDQIAMQEHGGANSDGHSRNGSDHRLFGRCKSAQILESYRRFTRLGSGKIGDVISCREALFPAGEHDNANIRIRLRALHCANEVDIHGPGESVLLFRTVNANRKDLLLQCCGDVLRHDAPTVLRTTWK